jgi:hypothetical protein
MEGWRDEEDPAGNIANNEDPAGIIAKHHLFEQNNR